MNKQQVIFIGAAPDFDEMLEMFQKFLNPDIGLKLAQAANRYKDDCQQMAIDNAKQQDEKLLPIINELVPLMEEYREACRRPGYGPGPNIRMRAVIKKVIELYKPNTDTP